MRFEEFKSLIEERRRLLPFSTEEKVFSRIAEIDKKLFPDKFDIYKGLSKDVYSECIKSLLNSLFEVGEENIVKMLNNFFKNKGEVLLNNKENSLWVEIRKNEECKVYSLGRDNKILSCLAGVEKHDWRILLRDYPELREYLWTCFRDLKQQEKRSQISLIERMINEKKNEQSILEIPKLREIKLEEIKREKRELESMLYLVKRGVDEIEI